MRLRFWIRHPYFTIPGVLSIASSVAACTFVFSLVKGVLLTPLPYDETDRMVLLRARNARLGETRPFVSVADFRDWQEGASSFSGLALFHWTQLDLWGEGASGTERVKGLTVTPEFFSVMGLEPAAGQWPEPEARNPADGGETIVLGRPLWSRRFGRDPALVGKTIAIGSWRSLPETGPVSYRVEAVVDGSSRFLPMTRGIGRQPVGVDDVVDFWLPVPLDEDVVPPREYRDLEGAVGRLKAGVSYEQAQAELEALSAALAEQYPDTNANWSVELVPLSEAVTGAIRPALLLLFGGVSLLFLVSCSNVCSMLLVRTMERRRELAVRSALGASASRLVGEIVAETVRLAAFGSALGVVFAAVGLRVLSTVAPPELPRVESIGIDSGVLLFDAGLVLAVGVLAAWGPAWLVARAERVSGLESGRRIANANRESRRLLRAFTAVAVGLAVMLLMAAGLVHQSLSRLLEVDPGYDRENLLTLTLSLPEARYSWRRNTEFLHEAIARVSRLPAVVAAGAVRGLPGRESRIEAPVFLPGRTTASDPSAARPRAQIRLVSPSYFEVMRVPVLAGRGFEPRDERGEIGYTRVVLVNETFARRMWPGDDAVGKTIHVVRADLPPIEVVGVVGDVRYRGLEHPPGMEIYYPEALFPQAQADLILRTETPPLELAPVVQDAIRALEPDVRISNVGSMEGVLQQTVADRRFASWLLAGFSSTALLLAAFGVGGVMAQSVSQRRKELGVRLALGARPGRIMGAVLMQSLEVTGIGLVLGTVVTATGAGLLSRFLYGIEPTDPGTYAAAALLTGAAATLASLVPAGSAAATDPLRVLRDD